MDPSPRDTGPSDPGTSADAATVRSTAYRIGLRIAGVAFALVLVGGVTFFIVLWWKAGGSVLGHHSDDLPDPDGMYVTVSLNTVDLVTATVAVGILAIAAAGLAGVFIARRAVAPLGEALARERRFVADASHELRTPLSVLHARVQKLSMQTPADDPRRPTVDALRDDSTVLVTLLDDLLDDLLTGLPAGAAPGDRDTGPADLRNVLDRVAGNLALLAERQGVDLEVTTVDATVQMPTTDLTRCLTALTDNAIRHTPAGGQVRVSAAVPPGGGVVCLTVDDDGPGVRGIDPGRVFERFAHGTAPAGAAGGERGSHGIGLFLVQELAHRAGGSVALTSTGPSGTEFTLRVPTAPGASTGGRR
ncbi:HAMP domain-containing sensor histidine kinase [Corynebacteriaceae bacterium 7-707]